jgi:hypothetical protein
MAKFWILGKSVVDITKISFVSGYNEKENNFSLVIDGRLVRIGAGMETYTGFVQAFSREFPATKNIA